ncbi:MAG TPA: hypothetical protein VNS55_12490 [Nocardioides sp.]|nr:hypothetical protein [Nocardioides sp.]
MLIHALRSRVVAACAVGLLLPLLAACGGDDGSGDLSVGDVVPARLGDQFESGRHATVAVPTGRLQVWADPATDTADRTDTRQLEALDAPDGATLVPITWKFLDDFPAAQPFVHSDARPVVDLVTEDGTYRLPTPNERLPEGESFYVVVDGDGSKVSLKVAFDGVAQTVDLRTGKRESDAGRAASLYHLDAERQRPQDCGSSDWDHPELSLADYTCDVTTRLLLPYADGRWAPEGHQYLAVAVRTVLRSWSVAGAGGGGAFYVGTASRLTAELDGEPADATIEDVNVECPVPASHECDGARMFVFEVGDKVPDRLQIDQRFRLALSSRFGGFRPADRIRGELKGTVRLDLP